MKLSEYAKRVGVNYRTAWSHYSSGKIPGAFQLETGTIVVPDSFFESDVVREERVAVYARVSSQQNRANLETQADRLLSYCAARGYKVAKVVKEVGSGVNDKRQKFQALLADPEITRIVVEHRDRATRFGFNYLQTLLEVQGRQIEVINEAEGEKEELMQDLIAIITSFVARYYGQGRGRRKTEQILKELKSDD